MKKRLFSLALVLAMCVSLCAVAFASPSNFSANEKRIYLVNTCNIPADFLNSVTDDIVSKIYEDATTNRMTVSSYAVENDFIGQSNENVLPTSISSSDFRLTTLVTKVFSGNTDNFLHYTVYVSYEWFDKNPFCRMSDDGITVNWDNTLLFYEAGSFFGRLYSKSDVTNRWVRYKDLTSTDETNQGGLGVSIPLFADKSTCLQGTIGFNLGTNFFGSGRTSTINGNYAHSYIKVAQTMTFSTQGFSVGFAPISSLNLCSSSANLTL